MSRNAERIVTVTELVHGITASRITPSTITAPSGSALPCGNANNLYTGPRDSIHLPDPMFSPMRLSQVSGETTEQDARPGMFHIPRTDEHGEPCCRSVEDKITQAT